MVQNPDKEISRKPKELEYSITPDDAAAFQRYHFKTSLSSPRYYVMRLVWGILASAMLFILALGWKNTWAVLLLILFWALYLVMIPLSIRRSSASYAKRLKKEGANKALWGKRRLTINAQELVESSEVEESRIRWAGVERVTENSDYIFIYLTTVSAQVIPKRFFIDSAQAQLFYQTAKNYFDQAHQKAG